MSTTYLARVTLMKHFEHIHGALVPLQTDINYDCKYTERNSNTAFDNFAAWKKSHSSYLRWTFQ